MIPATNPKSSAQRRHPAQRRRRVGGVIQMLLRSFLEPPEWIYAQALCAGAGAAACSASFALTASATASATLGTFALVAATASAMPSLAPPREAPMRWWNEHVLSLQPRALTTPCRIWAPTARIGRARCHAHDAHVPLKSLTRYRMIGTCGTEPASP